MRTSSSVDRSPAASAQSSASSRLIATFPLLEPLLQRHGGVLSGGEQQLLAVARSLVGNPRLMLLDEPSEGLAPKIVAQLAEAVRMVHERFGVTVLLAEQNTPFALSLADSIAIIDTGRVVFTGSAADLAADPEILERYLGVRGSAVPSAGRQGADR